MEDLIRLRPSLHLPGPPEDYQLVPCKPSDQVTWDLGDSYFYMFKTLFTQVKLDFLFPLFYCGLLLVLQVAIVQIQPNG